MVTVSHRCFDASRLIALAAVLWLGISSPLEAQTLQSIRNDVNNGTPPASQAAASQPSNPQPSSSSQSSDSDSGNGVDSDTSFGLLVLGAIAVGGAVTVPIWAPGNLLGDDFSHPAVLHQFPYDDTRNPPETFPFALRFDVDYVEGFDNLDRFNGHFLFSTASRFEFDARAQYLSERLFNSGQDKLWMGDCNVTYRFAQGDFGQFRAGIGLNWMNQPSQTDLGFNFTYGADIFPIKPLVLSMVLDAGNLGRAGLFRIRTTAGMAYRSVEFYTGYEYTDIGSVHWNGLIGGIRLWF